MLATKKGRPHLGLIIFSVMFLSNAALSNGNYLFYIYGSSFCPACRFAKEILSSAYGVSAVVFRDIYAVKKYMEDYLRLYSLFNLGNESYIPLIVIYSDSTLEAVVVGATPTEEENVTKGWSDFLGRASKEQEVLVSVGGVMKKIEYAKVASEVYEMVLEEEDKRVLALSLLQVLCLFNSKMKFSEKYYVEDAIFNYSGVSYFLPDIPEVIDDIRSLWKDPYVRFKEFDVKRGNGLLWVEGVVELFTQDGTKGEGVFRIGFTRVENDFKIAKESLEVRILEV
ncbi:MAG: hypothetical protein DRJ36_00980 [Thermoprotei archaeon]|nr:MAG: hypothetical protein DRJ36_00980 [Thermoprotei archaeon]